jgi:hypothetical protein
MSTKPPAEPRPSPRPEPERLDDAALDSVSGGKLHFDDGVTTFWDPTTGQVTTTPP